MLEQLFPNEKGGRKRTLEPTKDVQERPNKQPRLDAPPATQVPFLPSQIGILIIL